MAGRTRKRPTDAELVILRVLWEHGPSTVRQVNRILNETRPTGYTTALKQIQIMTGKGLLRRDESARPMVYKPAFSQDQTRQQLGLDEPLPVQYGRYLLNTLRGDLGRSFYSNRPVTLTIAEQLPATLQLAVAALLVAVIVGLSLGILAALRADSWIDQTAMGVAVLGVSVPVFWSGLLLIWIFSVNLNWLPATGADGWRHLVMPAMVLGLVGAGPIARLTRASLLKPTTLPLGM